MEIRRLGPDDAAAVEAAAHLFDDPPYPEHTTVTLAAPQQHLLIAYEDDGITPTGFVSGVEMHHPDKGAEMFLYELGADEGHRGKGVGTALVQALATIGKERGCYGMWVLTDPDNDAALATYTKAGATRSEPPQVMLEWTF